MLQGRAHLALSRSRVKPRLQAVWVPSVEFSRWSWTQFLATIQSPWVSLRNSNMVRHWKGVLVLPRSHVGLPEWLQHLVHALLS